MQPLGSILTTTTASVVLIYHGETGGSHHGIACRTLKPPQGTLTQNGQKYFFHPARGLIFLLYQKLFQWFDFFHFWP